MSFFRPMMLALLGTTMLAAPASAVRQDRLAPQRSALADYVHARVADDLGELSVAASGFASAAAQNPDDRTLGLRAFRHAVSAGDMPLALKTARTLDANGSLPPDGTLLLLSDAVSRRDWKHSRALVDRIDRERLFAFLSPVLRAWIAYGSRDGDPLTPLGAPPAGALAASYAAEHRALLLVATGQDMAGMAALSGLSLPEGARATRLRIAMAAVLERRHQDSAARAVLTGEGPAIRRARALLAEHHKLKGAIDTPAAGLAELFVRVASDINKDQAAPLALHFARLATLLSPGESEAWLVCASLLSQGDAQEAALDALSHVSADDVFAGAVRDARVTLLMRAGRADQALAETQAAIAAPDASTGDWARMGDLLVSAHRPADAAAAYARALALAGEDNAPVEMAWPLLLQRANALLESGDWPAAKVQAKRALVVAPQQPEVLNFLGYSEIEHGDDVDGASAMIAKASALAPDDPSITDSLGWSWYMRGDLNRAIPLLERAARGAPAASDINEHLGDAYWKAARRLAARYAWRAALVVADGDQANRLKAKIDYGLTAKP